MRILKKILIVLLIIIAIPLVVALFVPKESASEGQVIINQPKEVVFDYIKYVKNQDNFGKWQLSDPNIKTTSEGEDGTVGFKYSWESEKLGKGAQEIVGIIDGERLDTHMFFYDFDETPNPSYFTVEEKGTDQTLVKWGISWKSKYPFNLMNLFINMDKDFNEGLNNLKEILENQPLKNEELAFLNNYFEETFQHLKDNVSNLNQEQLQFKPSEDQWSVSQCLEHITLTEEMIFGSIEEYLQNSPRAEDRGNIKLSDQEILNFLTDRTEKFKASEDLTPIGKYTDVEVALNDLKNQREALHKLLENTSIDDLRNRVNESPFGPIDVYQSILFMGAHTARHTLQIEEIKSNPNFPN